MKKQNWIWMPHAGHFICSDRCRFHINTYVGKYIVSTVGEMKMRDEDNDWYDIGYDRKYETMVFSAKKQKEDMCCPYRMTDPTELDMNGYKTAEDAYKGHLKLCRKWSRK